MTAKDIKYAIPRIIMLTLLFEVIALVCRFVLGLEASVVGRDTIGSLTFNIRIHHGYIGVLMILAGFLWPKEFKSTAIWITIIGVSLFVSDLIHHFAVLWPITGDHQFHLIYPNS